MENPADRASLEVIYQILWDAYKHQLNNSNVIVSMTRSFFDTLGPVGEEVFIRNASRALLGRAEFFQDSRDPSRVILATPLGLEWQAGSTIQVVPGQRLRVANGAGASGAQGGGGQPGAAGRPHIKKPPNAFVLFRRDFSSRARQAGTTGNARDLSGPATVAWDALSEKEQQVWYDLAHTTKIMHQSVHPEYYEKRTRQPSTPQQRAAQRARRAARRAASQLSLRPLLPAPPPRGDAAVMAPAQDLPAGLVLTLAPGAPVDVPQDPVPPRDPAADAVPAPGQTHVMARILRLGPPPAARAPVPIDPRLPSLPPAPAQAPAPASRVEEEQAPYGVHDPFLPIPDNSPEPESALLPAQQQPAAAAAAMFNQDWSFRPLSLRPEPERQQYPAAPLEEEDEEDEDEDSYPVTYSPSDFAPYNLEDLDEFYGYR
ncbi:hypothetical protein F5Y17DRAFT_475619 [Xylariaceae sp. FL0594]|nr:hypothetical protein F5Y17DRAFT_475619 [Xylariaceae sp. FL0594]